MTVRSSRLAAVALGAALLVPATTASASTLPSVPPSPAPSAPAPSSGTGGGGGEETPAPTPEQPAPSTSTGTGGGGGPTTTGTGGGAGDTGSLPFTGGELLPVAGAGVALLVVGTGLLAAARRRRVTPLS